MRAFFRASYAVRSLHLKSIWLMCHRYNLVGFEDCDDSGDRLTACNKRRLVLGCVSALVSGDVVAAAQDLTNSRLHLNAFEQGLGYFLLNALSSLLMIQSTSSSASSSDCSPSSSNSVLLLPNTSLSIVNSWLRLHPPASRRSARRLSEVQCDAAKQCALLLLLNSTFNTPSACTLRS
jgi:hypothetical protein